MSNPNSSPSPENYADRAAEPRPPLTGTEAQYVADVLEGTATSAATPGGVGHRIESGPNAHTPEGSDSKDSDPVEATTPPDDDTDLNALRDKIIADRKAGIEPRPLSEVFAERGESAFHDFHIQNPALHPTAPGTEEPDYDKIRQSILDAEKSDKK